MFVAPATPVIQRHMPLPTIPPLHTCEGYRRDLDPNDPPKCERNPTTALTISTADGGAQLWLCDECAADYRARCAGRILEDFSTENPQPYCDECSFVFSEQVPAIAVIEFRVERDGQRLDRSQACCEECAEDLADLIKTDPHMSLLADTPIGEDWRTETASPPHLIMTGEFFSRPAGELTVVADSAHISRETFIDALVQEHGVEAVGAVTMAATGVMRCTVQPAFGGVV